MRTKTWGAECKEDRDTSLLIYVYTYICKYSAPPLSPGSGILHLNCFYFLFFYFLHLCIWYTTDRKYNIYNICIFFHRFSVQCTLFSRLSMNFHRLLCVCERGAWGSLINIFIYFILTPSHHN